MKTTKEQRATYRSLFAESQTPLAFFVKHIIDGLEAAEAEVKRLREQTQWRPIETAPKDGSVIIVASTLNKKIVHVRMATWNGLGWYEVYSGAGINYVSLWVPIPPLPLPQPPQSESK